jgi:hypothetical protein
VEVDLDGVGAQLEGRADAGEGVLGGKALACGV